MALTVKAINRDHWRVYDGNRYVGYVWRCGIGGEAVYLAGTEGQRPEDAARCASFELAMTSLMDADQSWEDDTIVGAPELADDVARAIAEERERQVAAIRRVRQRWANLDMVLENLENEVLGRVA